jgi:putative integral membrane protein (TIGR02587 family)
MSQKEGNGRTIRRSFEEYSRGVAGGLLFSFPLLFTMEVWQAGFIAAPLDLLILLAVTYLLLLGYNRYAGLHPDESWRNVFIDSIEEIGIGLLLSFGILLMINQISLASMGVYEILGKVIVEAMGVSIGVSIGTAQLGADESEQEEEREGKSKRRDSNVALIVLALCGAVVIGGNVAPTEEVLLIALESTPVHLLSMACFSLGQSVVLIFFSNFHGTANNDPDNPYFKMFFDVCVSYVIALVASGFILWFFGRFDGVSFETAFAQVIVLGVLASLGASAGRLLIK